MSNWNLDYRPQKFADLHLREVSEQMKQLAETGNLPQVLLFAGPKGTGKTSTARIIAALLNSKDNEATIEHYYFQKKGKEKKLVFADPDVKDPEVVKILRGNSYLVVEIDAASHRGIDDVRSLQEQIYLPPTMGKVMVYILDEVHMFTPEAFNAMLKVLEEPPAHAFFILATTELHKIPATVVSRCRVINFRQATTDELVTAFENILKQEKIKAEPEALSEIAGLAEGSFRDGVQMLQAVSNQGKITLEQVQKTLVGNQKAYLEQLIQIILAKDELKLVEFFAELRSKGFEEKFLVKNLYNLLYAQLIGNLKRQKDLLLTGAQAQFLLKQLMTMPSSSEIPYLNLELTILGIFAKSKKK